MAEYDLAIVGAGAAGLIAADFARRLGARVALLERDRIGGDCTWNGCVPSKSLLRAAAVAQCVRHAGRYGIDAGAPRVDLGAVRAYLRATIRHIHAPTSPEALRAKGLAVYLGAARFIDAHTIESGTQRLRARRILICTGARPRRPALPGLAHAPYLTYQEIFENDRLPQAMVVVGGGPLGCEVAQSYRRLGARVTLVAPRLLPRAEPQASELLARVFADEGIEWVRARALAVRAAGERLWVRSAEGEHPCELLFVAVGRVADTDGLALEAAGVRHGERGIEVNARLQTSVRHIYAAGDCVGGAQFSHLAGWQAFLAARNALLPGRSAGVPRALPEVTFTAPEVAHVGLTEWAARERFGARVRAQCHELGRVDRAVSEGDRIGLVKLVALTDGRLLGATVMGERGGEALAEIALAMQRGLTLQELAASVHPYPTYNSALQLLAAQMALDQRLCGFRGRLLRALVRRALRAT